MAQPTIQPQETNAATFDILEPPMYWLLLCHRQSRLGGRIMFSAYSVAVCPSFRLFVRLFVTNLMNTTFRKRLNRFWCTLAQVVNGTRGWSWNDQLWGQEIKGKDHTTQRPGGGIILDPFGRAGFLVSLYATPIYAGNKFIEGWSMACMRVLSQPRVGSGKSLYSSPDFFDFFKILNVVLWCIHDPAWNFCAIIPNCSYLSVK